MKTTVKNTWGGSVIADRVGPGFLAIEFRQGSGVAHCFLDKHAAYVLGSALIHLAQNIEAEEGAKQTESEVCNGVAL